MVRSTVGDPPVQVTVTSRRGVLRVLGGGRNMRRTNWLLCASALVLAALLPALTAQAFPFSFENDLQGWTVSGFNDQPATVTRSNVVATDGQFSMAVTQMNQG